MNKSLLAGLSLLGLAAAVAAEPTVCARLADEARRLPPAAWDGAEPLARWLRPSRAGGAKRTPTEQALANDARWRDAVTAESAEQVGVHHLSGTPLYLIDFVSGTAHCQQYVLAQVRPGALAQPLASPFTPNTGLCMGGHARLTRVMNQPALVTGDAPSAGSAQGAYQVAVWTDQGWGPACGLKLRLRTTLAPVRRFCAPTAAVCEAGQAVALSLAMASEAGDAADAAAGPPPGDEVLAALNPPLRDPGAVGDVNLPLPTFGADDRRSNGLLMQFSNSSGQRLPVFIDGRWWLAVVGRAGIGWRVGDAVNVALFALPGRASDAVASYQFGFRQGGLLEATAVDEPR